jgi:Flp pilus assembly protein TadD
MFRFFVSCVIAALLNVAIVPLSVAADDRVLCSQQDIAACTRLIARDPRNPAPYLIRGYSYVAKGDFDNGIADYDHAIQLNLKGAIAFQAYLNRGLALGFKHDFDRAIADLDLAIKLDPKSAIAYSSRGSIYEEKGDYARAIADHDQALRISPNDAIASKARAHLQAVLAAQARPVQTGPGASSAVAGRRVALVIGNSRYASAPSLPNPRRDAEAVAAALQLAGFQTVTLKTDLGRDAMRDALRAFRALADAADWSLIYYAGHGIQIGKTNYLVPVDATLRDERDIEGEAVSYSELESTIDGSKAIRIIILDACRTDPFAGQMVRRDASRSIPRGLSAPPEPKPGLLVVYSAKDGQVAEDGDGGNSPFAKALVAHLNVPGREVRRVFDDVRDDVLEGTNNRQQPFTYGSLTGKTDFFFVAGK